MFIIEESFDVADLCEMIDHDVNLTLKESEQTSVAKESDEITVPDEMTPTPECSVILNGPAFPKRSACAGKDIDFDFFLHFLCLKIK